MPTSCSRLPIPAILLTPLLLLVACGTNPSVGSLLNPTSTPTIEVHDTPVPLTVATAPIISLAPAQGGPRARITVTGRGFPGGARIIIRLAPAEDAVPKSSYGEAFADATGAFTAVIILPGEWPTGTPIFEQKIVVLASVADTDAGAGATLGFRPDASALAPAGAQEAATDTPTTEPRLAQARSVVEAFLEAYQKDPGGKGTLIYLTPALQGKAQKGPGIAALLAISGTFSSFAITSVEAGDDPNTIVARADLNASPAVTRVFLLTETDGVWKIADIAQE